VRDRAVVRELAAYSNQWAQCWGVGPGDGARQRPPTGRAHFVHHLVDRDRLRLAVDPL